jgi:hypothetical protein
LANLNSLDIIILEIINKTKETLKSIIVDWCIKAVNFIKATSFIILDKPLEIGFPSL